MQTELKTISIQGGICVYLFVYFINQNGDLDPWVISGHSFSKMSTIGTLAKSPSVGRCSNKFLSLWYIMKFVSSWNFSSKQSREEEGIFVKKSIYLSFTRRQLFDISCAVEVNEAKSLITPVNNASLKNSSLNIELMFYWIGQNLSKVLKVLAWNFGTKFPNHKRKYFTSKMYLY